MSEFQPVTPVQIPDAVGNYERLQQLRNQQQLLPLQQQAAQQSVQEGQQRLQSGALDIQKQQIALKDQQALNTAMQQWAQPKPTATLPSGSSSLKPGLPSSATPAATPAASSMPNYDDLIDLAKKNGASFSAIQGLQSSVLAMKEKAATIAKDDAQTGNDNANALKTKNGMIIDAMSGVMNLPDQQLIPGLLSAAQELQAKGLLDPQHLQQAQQLAQLGDPAKIRQSLQTQITGMGGFNKLLEDAQKKAQAVMEQGKVTPGSPYYAPSAAAVASNTAALAGQIKAGETQQAATTAAADAKARFPYQVAVAKAEGQARADVAAQVARGSGAAVAQVPPHLVGPATAAATKAGEDYAQANSVSQRMAEMLNDAKKGNVVSYQLLPQEGALQLTTSQGVKRINMAEIQNYGGGSLWQNLEGHLGKALTGRSIPDSVLNDMSQIQDLMSRGADVKYANTLHTINQTYGAQFEPVKMEAIKPPATGTTTRYKIVNGALVPE